MQNLGVLRSVRSEYGKQIRKEYECGRIKISRHSFLQKEIREDGICNTLDSVQKDNLFAVKVMGVCDDQGRINKPLDIKDTAPTIRSETHGNIPKVTYDVSVEVKEATKKGYSVCRGGARFRQPHDAGKQDKKRTSRGRYGKYIRYKL